jgi:hypothetical protein
MADTAHLLAALDFAAHKHRGQRRKGTGDTPYVNHVIGGAHTLATVGGITDMVTLVAAHRRSIANGTIPQCRLGLFSFGALFSCSRGGVVLAFRSRTLSPPV